MTNLKDQIEENITKERERAEELRRNEYEGAEAARTRFDEIRPKLDELSHSTDKYDLKVGYGKSPYSQVIAVVELNDMDGAWVAAWHVGAMVGDRLHDWVVSYDPRLVGSQHEWFANTDDLFKYLTTCIAERIVEMEADEG